MIWKILKTLFGIVLFFATIVAAQAVSIDNPDYFITHPGQNLTGSVIFTDIRTQFIIEENSDWLTITNHRYIENEVVKVDYEINIPDNTPIDFYKIDMIVVQDEERYITPIRIEVQHKFYVFMYQLFRQKYMPYFAAFILLLLTGIVIKKGLL